MSCLHILQCSTAPTNANARLNEPISASGPTGARREGNICTASTSIERETSYKHSERHKCISGMDEEYRYCECDSPRCRRRDTQVGMQRQSLQQVYISAETNAAVADMRALSMLYTFQKDVMMSGTCCSGCHVCSLALHICCLNCSVYTLVTIGWLYIHTAGRPL